ncbi:SDR family NAD(P)-dependent oxidoreductase [Allosaccharopolyspora coralli]|uniref:SDR family NAD(P)-dependent oxidoreductase n=1 Tax=Allosaccharopolyspora coralli TaxID=2665642 RepID=A0A5Q3QHL5_9PSEU|nr:SDR family oxidoreductase [Allosaccharopolyspora coralli]QGK70327.1 SDR family NAD(P)-dependent oxidoreductase [Allosaccharopolyspora coralli]
MSRTALVTGASSGIGHAVASALVARGYRVIGTSRKPESIADSMRIPEVRYEELDLADNASIDALVDRVGAVDVVVNNAGESQSGPLEDLPTEVLERLFRLNVFGAVRLTQSLLPGMRARGHGRVVMIGSMLASFPLAYRSSYVASKAAIKGFATAARRELAPFGVWVTTVEPGSINTGISERRTKYLADGSVHAGRFRTMLAHLDRNERRGISADTVAGTVVKAIDAGKPRSLYAVGSNAPFVFALRRLVPRSVVERIVARKHGLS